MPYIDQLNNYARKKITDRASRLVDDYTNELGRSEFSFSLNTDFSLRNANFDILLPLSGNESNFEDGNLLLFVQPGVVINSNDLYQGRDFAHIGFGIRGGDEDSIWGTNFFYDRDITRGHQRGSLGIEYINKHLTLSGNYYFPLSGWKDSPSAFETMGNGKLEERPANALGLRFKGYIPHNRSFFVSADYQQFFGEYVESRSGKDPIENLFKLSTAINYKPIPIMTLSTGYSYEKGGEQDFNVGVQGTYRLGVPLAKQFDRTEADSDFSIASHFLDLVDRDHNVRLEYRKKLEEVLLTFNTSTITMMEGSKKALSGLVSLSGTKSQVTSWVAYGSAKHDVSTQDRTKFYTAPRYKDNVTRLRDNSINQYELFVEAKLATGQVVRTTTPLLITVTPDQTPSLEKSRLTIQSINPINGDSKTAGINQTDGLLVSASFFNVLGRPLVSQLVTLKADLKGSYFKEKNKPVIELYSSSQGMVEGSLLSKEEGTVNITAVLNGIELKQSGNFVDLVSVVDVSKSSLSVSPKKIVADGVATTTLELILKDKLGKPVNNQTVEFESDGLANLTIGQVKHNENGLYTASMKGLTAGSASITVKVNGSIIKIPPQVVILQEGNASAEHSEFIASKNFITADDSKGLELTLRLRDLNGNKVQSRDVRFKLAGVDRVNVNKVVENKGNYTAILTGQTAGKVLVSVLVDGKPFNIGPLTIEIGSGDAKVVKSKLTVSPNDFVAGDNRGSTLVLELNDNNGNPVTDQKVKFIVKSEGEQAFASPSFTLSKVIESKGRYTATIKSTSAQKLTVSALVNDTVFAVASQTVTIKPGEVSNSGSELSVSPATISAGGSTESTLTLALKDAHGNAVSGKTVVLGATGVSGVTVGATTESATSGTYTATLTAGNTAGVATTTVTVDGESFAVASKTVTIEAGEISTTQSSLSVSPATITAGGSTGSTLTLVLKDAHGNAVSGKTVV
ncbi:hypothetical protein HW45_03420, partial [Vibrio sp. ER1A]